MDLTDLKTALDDYQATNQNQADSLKQRIDRLETQIARPDAIPNGSEKAVLSEATEHKAAFFNDFILKGDDAPLKALEKKVLSTVTGGDGGFAVPEMIDTDIERQLKALSPIRTIARVKAIETSDYKRLVSLGSTASGWVGETSGRAETAAPSLAEVAIVPGEIYANAAATQRALDDMQFDAEAWLLDEVSEEFAAQEGAAFVNGSGVNQPKGFLTYQTANSSDAGRTFGTLQHVPTGTDGNWAAADPSDVLIDLVHTLNPRYRQGARFVLNAATLAEIRKFRDADGNFIWRPGLADGQADTLLGYPVVESEDMPDIAPDSLSVAFGNFDRGYTIVERTGTRVLRDPYSNKPYVNFYATRRVGGAVVNSDAIKLIKFGTS